MVSLGPRQRAFLLLASVLLSSPDQIFARFDGFTGPDSVVNQGIGKPISILLPRRIPISLSLVNACQIMPPSPFRFRFVSIGLTRRKIVGVFHSRRSVKNAGMVGWKFGKGTEGGRSAMDH